MKIAMRIYDEYRGEFVESNGTLLMDAAGMDVGMGFEDFGLQSDGTLVVFDRCGNFGYLSPKRFEMRWGIDED